MTTAEKTERNLGQRTRTFYIPNAMGNEFDIAAKEEDMSASQLMRRLIKEYLAKRKKK